MFHAWLILFQCNGDVGRFDFGEQLVNKISGQAALLPVPSQIVQQDDPSRRSRWEVLRGRPMFVEALVGFVGGCVGNTELPIEMLTYKNIIARDIQPGTGLGRQQEFSLSRSADHLCDL